MSRYDEDLYENPFFIALERDHKALFEKATANRWVICIPKYSCLKNHEFSKPDFEDHILVPSKESEHAFSTVSHHKVEIQQGQITLGSSLKAKKVDILFEETFYNNRDENYRVVCVSGLFNKPPEQDASEESSLEMSLCRPPVTYDECINILWGHQGSVRTRESLDKMLKIFCGEYQRFEASAENIANLADLVSSHVTKAMQIVLKDNSIKQLIKQHGTYMASLKIAVETYVMNAVHKHLFSTITACVKAADAIVNKMTRNLVEIRLQHLEIRQEFEENIPYAKKELSRLNQYSTPLGRIFCLKRVVAALTKPLFKSEENESDGGLVMTSDDLLPLLIYLIIKSQIPNWRANLMYMKHFQVAKMVESDEFSFYLATAEAALDFISSGNLKTSKPLAYKEGVFSRQTSGGSTSSKERFFQYVQYGDEAAVSLMLKKQKPGIDDLASKLCHPLCTCDKCSEITAGSSQNSGAISAVARDDMGRTALHIAAFYGQGSLIDILVKNGCVIDGTDYLGCTALHLASQKGFQNIILLLVHFGANVGAADNEGNTPLHLCAKNGHEDCVKAILFLDILKNKLNVNAQNDMGDTPLHMAARWGYDGIVNFLLESEADPRVRNRKRQTPYNVAQNADIKKELEALMIEPVPLPVQQLVKPSSLPVTSCIDTPSSTSPNTQLPSSAPSLSEHNTPEVKSQLGFTVVSDANTVKSPIQLIDNREMMSPTTPAVATLDSGDYRQIERLFKAIANGDLPLVAYYFGWAEESGSSEDSPVSPPSTPVNVDRIASKLCHPLCQCDKCKHIQKHTSVNALDVNCRNRKGYAAIHTCIIEKNMEVLDLLLKKGAFVNVQTYKNITPLHLACFHNSFEMVQKLVSHGANVNLQDQHGEIPLHLAAAKANIQIVKFLIEHSSSVNLGNVNGNTCLHHAACIDSVEVVRVLLENGARPDVFNKYNKSPADLAKSTVIIDMLKKKQEDMEKKNVDSDMTEKSGVDKLKTLAAELDEEHLKNLQHISDGIKSFNKLTKLKRSRTFDHSAPSINTAGLKLSLSIQHFDKSKSLRKARTLDRSSPILMPLGRSLSIQHFDTGSLKHVEPVDKSNPLHLYSLSRTFSSYQNYSDTSFEDRPKELESQKAEVAYEIGDNKELVLEDTHEPTQSSNDLDVGISEENLVTNLQISNVEQLSDQRSVEVDKNSEDFKEYVGDLVGERELDKRSDFNVMEDCTQTSEGVKDSVVDEDFCKEVEKGNKNDTDEFEGNAKDQHKDLVTNMCSVGSENQNKKVGPESLQTTECMKTIKAETTSVTGLMSVNVEVKPDCSGCAD